MPDQNIITGQDSTVTDSATVSASTDGVSQNPTVEELAAKLATLEGRLKTEIDEKHAFKRKLRDFEKQTEDATSKALEEQGKYKELYESTQSQLVDFKSKYQTRIVNEALQSAITASGAKSASTVEKLIDKSKVIVSDDGVVDIKSIQEQLEALKGTDPILFGGGTLPDPKRAAEQVSGDAFMLKLADARKRGDMKLIQELARSLNK